jgi:DNA-binding Lrp family transcriptional regulator
MTRGPGVGSLESLREQNRRRVIRTLQAAGPVSRAEIARRTGLSRTTISSLAADLQAAGLLGERAEVLGALALVLRDSDCFVSSQLRLAAEGR